MPTARPRRGPDGMPSGELLARIRSRVLDLVAEQYADLAGADQPATRCRADPHPHPQALEPAPAALAAGLFRARGAAGAVAAGAGSGASVPAHPQQDTEHRGGAEGARRVRPRRPHGAGARAAFAAADHPRAGRSQRPGRAFRVPGRTAAGLRRPDVSRPQGGRLVPVPGHPQQRADRRGGGGGKPRARAQRGTDRPRLCASGAAGDRQRLPEGDHRDADRRTSSWTKPTCTAATARSTSSAPA